MRSMTNWPLPMSVELSVTSYSAPVSQSSKTNASAAGTASPSNSFTDRTCSVGKKNWGATSVEHRDDDRVKQGLACSICRPVHPRARVALKTAKGVIERTIPHPNHLHPRTIVACKGIVSSMVGIISSQAMVSSGGK